MQPRRGRGYRSAFAGIDGLVAFAIAAAIFPCNIRGQRHVSQPLDSREEIWNWVKANTALAKASSHHDLGHEFGPCCVIAAKIQLLPNAYLPPRAHQAFPFVRFL